MSSRRILVVTPVLPYPPTWGAGMRNFQLLQHLARHDEVTLLSFGGPDSKEADVEALERIAGRVLTVPMPGAALHWKRPAQVVALLSPLTYQHMRVRSPAMQAAIRSLTRTWAPHVIQVESSQMGRFDFGHEARVVLDEHNIEHELLGRMAAVEPSPLRRLYNRMEERKFRKAEISAWRRFDGLVFTSERERAIAAATSARPATAIANGVDLQFFRPPDVKETAQDIVFTGIQSYRPNHDAALHFARAILPLVRRRRPEARFWIVGQGPSEEIRRLAGTGIEVTGWVQDVRPYLARAAVVVAPLRMGGGTRLKILEALAMARPVVSTPIGCEGLEVSDGEHLFVAETPETFARHVVRLLDDRSLARRMGEQGRRLVERAYGWGALAARLRDFHTQLLEAGPGLAAPSPARRSPVLPARRKTP